MALQGLRISTKRSFYVLRTNTRTRVEATLENESAGCENSENNAYHISFAQFAESRN